MTFQNFWSFKSAKFLSLQMSWKETYVTCYAEAHTILFIMIMTACKSIQTGRDHKPWCLVSLKQRMHVGTFLALRLSVCHSEVITNLTQEDVSDNNSRLKKS